jgi:hypothetical protein
VGVSLSGHSVDTYRLVKTRSAITCDITGWKAHSRCDLIGSETGPEGHLPHYTKVMRPEFVSEVVFDHSSSSLQLKITLEQSVRGN